jgi:hypothetical protein
MMEGDDSQATLMEGLDENVLSLENPDVIVGLLEVIE